MCTPVPVVLLTAATAVGNGHRDEPVFVGVAVTAHHNRRSADSTSRRRGADLHVPAAPGRLG